jgi:predicted XRE-type DNA-binding protein
MKDAGTDVQRLKSALAAEIRRMLDVEQLSVREAQARTGIAAADFSRIRGNSDLKRFTIDRLMAIINRLGSRIEVSFLLQQLEPADSAALNTSPSL